MFASLGDDKEMVDKNLTWPKLVELYSFCEGDRHYFERRWPQLHLEPHG